MFLILPLLLISSMLSLLSLAIFSALYGMALILLAHGIRNVRLETSRRSLREFLVCVSIDHYLSAASALGCILVLGSLSPDAWLWYATAHSDPSYIITLNTFLALFLVVFLAIGMMLQAINPDLRTNVAVTRQMSWVPWTHVMTIVGLALNLPTLGCSLIVMAPYLWHISRLDRVSRQSNLIWTLAIAVRQGLPLGPEVEILANGMWGRRRWRLLRLSENLSAGLSLSAALERQPGLVPLSSIMLIRMGEETNSLAPALDNCAANFTRTNDRQADLMNVEQGLVLLAVPLFVMVQIVGFLCYYIVPKFKKIFLDFGMELPDITVDMIHVADMAVRYGGPLFVLGCLAGVGVGIYSCFRDWERGLPILSLFAPRADGPPILRALALIMRQHQSLETGLDAMSQSHPNRAVRRKLAAINSRLADGRDLPHALADQRLIRPGDAALLKTAERVQNMPWVLEQLAEMIEQKFWLRMRLILEIGYPVGLIVVGGIVLFIVLAFYMPLVSLINMMSMMS